MSNISLMSVNPDTEPEITINPDTREIDIPTELYNIAVVADDNSEMVKLRIPRYFDGNDLSKRNCTISYNNAANKRGVYTVRNITIEEDTPVTKDDIISLGIPSTDTNTTYSVATHETDGLMDSQDKVKIDNTPNFIFSTTVPTELPENTICFVYEE